MSDSIILDLSAMPEPERRKECYAQNPNVYEVDGCPKCEGRNITWSEYEKHIWCFDCWIDYVPAHAGIFDGPIPMGAAELMGVSFDRIDIATGQIIPFVLEKPQR